MSTQDIVLYITLASTALNTILNVVHGFRSGDLYSSCCGKPFCAFMGAVDKYEVDSISRVPSSDEVTRPVPIPIHAATV